MKPKLIKDLGLVYLKTASTRKRRCGMFECPKCLNQYRAVIYNVDKGNSKQCNSCSARQPKTHGESGSRLNNIYRQLNARCNNPNNPKYFQYGGRGIRNLFLSYKEFSLWAKANGYTDNLTIDRINNDKGYSSNNCRWVTVTIQNRNKRKSNNSEYVGVYKNTKGTRFTAKIGVNGEQIYLGYFEKVEDAVMARNTYITKENLKGFYINRLPKELK